MELNLTDEQCLYLIKLIEEKLKEIEKQFSINTDVIDVTPAD